MDAQVPASEAPQIKPRVHSKKADPIKSRLFLPERLFILAIDGDHGTVPSSIKTKLRYAWAGALFSEMMLSKAVNLEEGHLVINGSETYSEPWFGEILSKFASEKKPRKIKYWLNTIGKEQKFKNLTEQLITHHVISVDKKHYLWVIPYEAYPKINASAKYWVKQQLRGICLAGEKADLYDLALLTLLKECRLLRLVFTKDERTCALKKIKTMFHDEANDEAHSKSFAEINAVSEAVAGLAITS